MNRQRLILFVLLILLALAVVWSYLRWPRQQTVAALKYAPGQRAASPRPAGTASTPQPGRDDGRVVRLDLLDREQPVFKGYRRNIFKPLFVDEQKSAKQQAVAPPPPLQPAVGAQPPAVPLPVQPVAMPETPRRELTRFTFLGFLKKDNRKTIFLAKDRDIILVKQGDVFARRYEASSITDQALTILVADTGEEIVIPLVENQPLAAAAK